MIPKALKDFNIKRIVYVNTPRISMSDFDYSNLKRITIKEYKTNHLILEIFFKHPKYERYGFIASNFSSTRTPSISFDKSILLILERFINREGSVHVYEKHTEEVNIKIYDYDFENDKHTQIIIENNLETMTTIKF